MRIRLVVLIFTLLLAYSEISAQYLPDRIVEKWRKNMNFTEVNMKAFSDSELQVLYNWAVNKNSRTRDNYPMTLLPVRVLRKILYMNHRLSSSAASYIFNNLNSGKRIKSFAGEYSFLKSKYGYNFSRSAEKQILNYLCEKKNSYCDEYFEKFGDKQTAESQLKKLNNRSRFNWNSGLKYLQFLANTGDITSIEKILKGVVSEHYTSNKFTERYYSKIKNSTKLETQLSLSKYYSNSESDTERAIYHAKKVASHSRATKNNKQEAYTTLAEQHYSIDINKYIEYLKKALEYGNLRAAAFIAEFKFQKGNYKEAISYYEMLFNKWGKGQLAGNDAYYMGYIYSGKCCFKEKMAVEMAEWATMNGIENKYVSNIYYNLGVAFYNGEYVGKDDSKSVKYFQKACDLGLEQACTILKTNFRQKQSAK